MNYNNHQYKAYFALTRYEHIKDDTAVAFMEILPKIRRLAKQHLRCAVIACNGGDTNSSAYTWLERQAQRTGDWTQADAYRDTTLAKAEADTSREKLEALGRQYGLRFAFQGDPRGWTVRLVGIKDGNRWRDLGEYGLVQNAINE